MKDYKKILEGVVNIINTTEKSDIGFVNICAYIGDNCPELEESEDEKIRKELIKFVDCNTLSTTEQHDKYIAWLKKQGEQKPVFEMKTPEESLGIDSDTYNKIVDECIYGEQKPTELDDDAIAKLADEYYDTLIKESNMSENMAHHCRLAFFHGADAILKKTQCEQKPDDKIEPKFKVGDWLVHKDLVGVTCCITQIHAPHYYLTNNNSFIKFGEEDNYHLWTIQDAKDGDVLVCKGNIKYSDGIKYERICLFNNLDHSFFTLTKTSNHVKVYDTDVNIDYPDNTIPATKEQKEILFMAMADAGYTFDFEKKELNKIEHKSTKWSGEDEQYLLICNK